MTDKPPSIRTGQQRFKRIVARLTITIGMALWLVPALPFVQHFYGTIVRHRVEKRLRARGDWSTNTLVTNRFDEAARTRGQKVFLLLTNESLPWSLPSTFEITAPGVAVPIVLATNVSASSYANTKSNGWEFFAELLVTNQPHFAAVHRDIQRVPHDFGFDYSPNAWQFLEWSMRKNDGWENLLKSTEEHRNYLRGATLLAMRRRDTTAALDALEDFLTVNDLLKGQPTSVLQQSRMRGVRLASGLTWALLHEFELDDAELARLAALWSDVEVIQETVKAFESDLESFHAALESIANKTHSHPEEFFFGAPGTNATSEAEKMAEELGRGWATAGWRFLYGDETVATFAEQVALIAPAARSILEQHRSTQWIKLRDSRRESWKKDSTYKNIREFPMTIFFMSIDTDYDNLSRATEVESEIVLTQAAIAIARYRGRHGSYPKSAQDLVPEFLRKIPRDWQSGETIRYAPEGKDFKLYLVGWDGIDDGGSVEPRPGMKGYRNIWSGKDTVWLRRANVDEVEEWQRKRLTGRPDYRGRRSTTNGVPATTNSLLRTNFPAE